MMQHVDASVVADSCACSWRPRTSHLRRSRTCRYAGCFLGLRRQAMLAESKSHSSEVWCSQRLLVMACALPPNLRSPNT
jgi:hypothetical protein